MPEQEVALNSLKGVVWRLDNPKQILYATTPNDNLTPVDLSTNINGAAAIPVESSLGATLNYDLSGTSIGGQNSATGL